MKKSILIIFTAVIFAVILSVKTTYAQDQKPTWPGVTIKVLLDNENVNVSEVTFNAGAVADWHSHPQYTVYAVTDVKMKVEIKDKEPNVVEIKAGQAIWSPAVTHQTTNVGKNPFTVIVSEIKEVPHKH